jgi:MFS family permease
MRRYISVGSIYMFFFSGAYFIILYYLPIYFQSVYNSSPIGSGVKMLALIIPLTLAAIVQGWALSKIRIVPLFWIIGGALGTIGCGLLYTFDTDTSVGKWIGYQIIVGFSTGWTFQIAMSNAQVHAPPEDMSQATAIVNCECFIYYNLKELSANNGASLHDCGRSILSLSSTKRLQQSAD